jgi:hypothetical protein
MTINRERLISLAEWAGAEDARRRLGLPSEWIQEDWLTKLSCGTACCLAGKIALEDGGIPYTGEEDFPWEHEDDGFGTSEVTFPGSTEPVYVPDHARRALGLSVGQADWLFDSDNDLDDVLDIIHELLATADQEAKAAG